MDRSRSAIPVAMLIAGFLIGSYVGFSGSKQTFLGRPMDAEDLPKSARPARLEEALVGGRFRFMEIPIDKNSWQVVWVEDFHGVLPK